MGTICESYNPSDIDTQRFWDWQSTREKPSLDVPNGFPRRLDSSLAWIGENILDKESEWKIDLSAEDIAAVDAAVTAFDG